ncbi:hypothetical protein Hanom_Chr01g00054161 [Helianthus anomalus]
MSIPSMSTFISKYSNPITLQLLSHETLCSDFIICPLLKSLCEEVLAETHSVDRGLQEIKLILIVITLCLVYWVCKFAYIIWGILSHSEIPLCLILSLLGFVISTVGPDGNQSF